MKIKVRSKDGTSSHIDVDAQDSVLSVRQRLVRSLGDSPAQAEALQRWLEDSVTVPPPPVDAAGLEPAVEEWNDLVKRSVAATQLIIRSMSA